MIQILHIFHKDCRHHWPEILVSLLVLMTFAVDQPRNWTEQSLAPRFISGLLKALPILMVLAWSFLIVRLVQGESLVGDRQFWITRPYQWHKLLGAKLLAILLFVHLPLFVTQLSLLKIAHFPLISSVPGLLYVHIVLLFVMVLPSITIATITSGIGQASLAFLAVLLLVLGIVLLSTVMPDMDFATDATDTIQAIIYFCASVTAILIQYIYRKTFLSRTVVAVAVVSIFLVITLTPYSTLISRDFPLPSKTRPLPAQFTLDRALSFGHTEGQNLNFYGDEVQLEIPFQVVKLPDKTIAQIRAIKLELDSPTGEHWTSHWRSVYHTVSVGRTRDWPSLNIKRDVFNHFKDAPVRAHVSLGVNVFRLGSRTEIYLAGDSLSLPGGARCLNELSQNSLKCFAALKSPMPLFLIAELPSAACPVSEKANSDPWAESPAMFADLTGDSTPAFDFTPIQQFSVSFSRFHVFEDREIRLPICPGTPLLLSKPEFLYSVRDEIELGDVRLWNYVPTYPRIILPPVQRYPPGAPSNKLSWNLPRGFPYPVAIKTW